MKNNKTGKQKKSARPSKLPSISKYFNITNSSQDLKLSEESAKSEPTEKMTKASLDDSLDDFRSPLVFKERPNLAWKLSAQPKHKSKSKRGKGSKNSNKNSILNIIKENFESGGENPEHLQMAIALSKSAFEAENGSSSDKETPNISEILQNVKDTNLERFGFKSDKRPLPVVNRKMKTASEPSRQVRNRFKYVTPVLEIRSEEDRQSLISSKISLILCQSDNRPTTRPENHSEPSLISPLLSEMSSKKRKNIFQTDDLYESEYFIVNTLNLEKSCGKPGRLLREWGLIQGRDRSPQRLPHNSCAEEKSIETCKAEKVDCLETENSDFIFKSWTSESKDSGYGSANKDTIGFYRSISPDLFGSDEDFVEPETYDVEQQENSSPSQPVKHISENISTNDKELDYSVIDLTGVAIEMENISNNNSSSLSSRPASFYNLDEFEEEEHVKDDNENERAKSYNSGNEIGLVSSSNTIKATDELKYFYEDHIETSYNIEKNNVAAESPDLYDDWLSDHHFENMENLSDLQDDENRLGSSTSPNKEDISPVFGSHEIMEKNLEINGCPLTGSDLKNSSIMSPRNKKVFSSSDCQDKPVCIEILDDSLSEDASETTENCNYDRNLSQYPIPEQDVDMVDSREPDNLKNCLVSAESGELSTPDYKKSSFLGRINEYNSPDHFQNIELQNDESIINRSTSNSKKDGTNEISKEQSPAIDEHPLTENHLDDTPKISRTRKKLPSSSNHLESPVCIEILDDSLLGDISESGENWNGRNLSENLTYKQNACQTIMENGMLKDDVASDKKLSTPDCPTFLRKSGGYNSADLNVTDYVYNLLNQEDFSFDQRKNDEENVHDYENFSQESESSQEVIDEDLNYSSHMAAMEGDDNVLGVEMDSGESQENLDAEDNCSQHIANQPSTSKVQTSFVTKKSVETPDGSYIVKTKNVTPMPAYDQMTTPLIKKELEKIGVKPLKRARGAKFLKYVYESTHPFIGSVDAYEKADSDDERRVIKRRKKSHEVSARKKESCVKMAAADVQSDSSAIEIIGDQILENEKPENLIFERRQSKRIPYCRVPLQVVWHNFLCCNPSLKESILLYEPLQLEALHLMLKEQGFKFHSQDLLTFLDRKCITIRTAQKQGKRTGS